MWSWLGGLGGRLAAKLLGPRVLLGALVVALLGLGFVTWRWQSAVDASATASARVDEYAQALERTDAELARELAARKRLDQAIAERRAAEARARRRAQAAESKLRELERTDEEVAQWSDGRVPGAVRCWLREHAGAGEDGGTAGDAAGGAVSDVCNAAGGDEHER